MSMRFERLLNKQNLFIAGWFAATLLIVFWAGIELSALVFSEPVAESDEVRSVRRKLKKYEAVAAHEPRIESTYAILDKAFNGAPSPGSAASIVDAQDIMETLPHLSGIVRTLSADGKIRYRAMLDGKDLAEGDKIDGFTIQRISNDAVLLVKGGGRWPLRAPDAALTVRQK